MVRKNEKRSLVMIVLVVALFVFGGISPGISGGPEPPTGSKITGKAMSAILTAVQISINGWPVVVQVVVGECNGAPFQIGPIVNGAIIPENIGVIVDSDLVYQQLPDAGPVGCYSPYGGDDLIITKVTEFYNSGTAVSTEISLQMLQ